MSENRFHTRQAAWALLEMAKATSDPDLGARLIELAADLKEQAGEPPYDKWAISTFDLDHCPQQLNAAD